MEILEQERVGLHQTIVSLFKELVTNENSLTSLTKLERIVSDYVGRIRQELLSNKLKSSSIMDHVLGTVVCSFYDSSGDLSFCYPFLLEKCQNPRNVFEKRLAYLYTSYLIPPHSSSDLGLLMVNTMLKDMSSSNFLQIAMPMYVLPILNEECSRSLVPHIEDALHHQSDEVKRRAAITSLFLVKSNLATNTLIKRLKKCLTHPDASVMASSLSSLHALSVSSETKDEKIVAPLCHILRQIVDGHLEKVYRSSGISAPWIQIKIVNILGIFITSENPEISTMSKDGILYALKGLNTTVENDVVYSLVLECIQGLSQTPLSDHDLWRGLLELIRFFLPLPNSDSHAIHSTSLTIPRTSFKKSLIGLQCLLAITTHLEDQPGNVNSGAISAFALQAATSLLTFHHPIVQELAILVVLKTIKTKEHLFQVLQVLIQILRTNESQGQMKSVSFEARMLDVLVRADVFNMESIPEPKMQDLLLELYLAMSEKSRSKYQSLWISFFGKIEGGLISLKAEETSPHFSEHILPTVLGILTRDVKDAIQYPALFSFCLWIVSHLGVISSHREISESIWKTLLHLLQKNLSHIEQDDPADRSEVDFLNDTLKRLLDTMISFVAGGTPDEGVVLPSTVVDSLTRLKHQTGGTGRYIDPELVIKVVQLLRMMGLSASKIQA